MREVFQCGHGICICKTRKGIVLILVRLNNKQQQQQKTNSGAGRNDSSGKKDCLTGMRTWVPNTNTYTKPGGISPNLVLQKTETGGLWGLPAATLVPNLVKEGIQENKKITQKDTQYLPLTFVHAHQHIKEVHMLHVHMQTVKL